VQGRPRVFRCNLQYAGYRRMASLSRSV
jgi:hypothetical protein